MASNWEEKIHAIIALIGKEKGLGRGKGGKYQEKLTTLQQIIPCLVRAPVVGLLDELLVLRGELRVELGLNLVVEDAERAGCATRRDE